MKRFIGPLLVFTLLASPIHAQNRYPDDERRGGGATNGVWLGGRNSLPIGDGSSANAISSALALPAVRPMMDEFARRGYQRLPDGDAAFLRPNLTVVGITFRKPDWDPTYRTPVIYVVSRKEGDFFVTQAYGGIVGGDDPNGPLHVYDEWPDKALLVAGKILSGSRRVGTLRPEAGGTTPGEFAGFVTAYDPSAFGPMLSSQWDYQLYENTGYGAHVWSQYAAIVGSATLVGGLNGFRAPPDTWPGTVTWGAVGAWYVANTGFWATHDPGF
ncbi:MAG TPA: hypothetical protein VKF80_07095 [Candidatus Eisenbacteria bacterium]|nr:hypothetical protein [Candidatus Eisenbacteria bacterium]